MAFAAGQYQEGRYFEPWFDWDGGEIKYQRPYHYPKQLDAIFEPKRYSLIEASTKAGKTSGCINWIFEQAFFGRPGNNYWWVAPVSSQASIAFARMRRHIPRWAFRANLSDKTITLFNGTVIWFKSADKPDSLYGEDVYAAVVDEASRVKEDAWHAIRTTLTYTRGPVRIIGNVKGSKNWFYRLARRAEMDDALMAYHKIIAHDAIAAGVLSAEEVEDAKRILPEAAFNELYLAIATDDGSNPFGIAAIRKCIRPLSKERARHWGWDIAKKQDWTVGIGLDRNGCTAKWDRFQLPWPRTEQRIIMQTSGAKALVDSTGVGDPVLDHLQENGRTNFEGYTFSSSSKQKLMEGLAFAIQSGEIFFPDGPDGSREHQIVLELEQFEFVYTKTGVRYLAPEGCYDDCVMALALAEQQRRAGSHVIEVGGEAVERAANPNRKRKRFRTTPRRRNWRRPL